jgi:Flp pilus assembly protein TadD
MCSYAQRIPVVGLLGLLALAAGAGVVSPWFWQREPLAARQARQAVAAGRYDDAERALARWLKAGADGGEAHLLKGRVAAGAGRLSEAVDELKQAQFRGTDPHGAALLRAIIASKAGRHSEARATLKEAYDAGPAPDRQVTEALAKTYLETFDLQGAAVVLDHWARDFPTDPKPYLWRAEIDRRTEGGAEAVQRDYREALRRDPSLAPAHLGLARELCKAHRNDDAAAEYDAYFALEPGDAAAHLGAGQNLLAQGNESGAIRQFQRALELDPSNAEVYRELAETAARHGDWPTTLAHLDRAVALDPCDVTLRYRRGLAFSRLGRADEARAEQETAANLRHDLDRLSAARRRLVDSPHDRESQLEIARWMFDHAQEQEGARWARKLLDERPDDPEASRLLAAYHARRGETALANFYGLHAQPSGPSSTAHAQAPENSSDLRPSAPEMKSP